MFMNEIPEEKRWQYMSELEISVLPDIKMQSFYRRKISNIVKFVINPLYMYALKHGFDDTDFLKQTTVHGYVEELKLFFETKEIDRQGCIEIISKGRKQK